MREHKVLARASDATASQAAPATVPAVTAFCYSLAHLQPSFQTELPMQWVLLRY